MAELVRALQRREVQRIQPFCESRVARLLERLSALGSRLVRLL